MELFRLTRVVAHNAAVARHPGRPLCDTTHCQAFQGTVPASRADLLALAAPALPYGGWLLFSQGGDEPWTERKSERAVAAVLGGVPVDLRFAEGQVSLTRVVHEGGSTFESATTLPCELLRNPLHLPSCPSAAVRNGGEFVFSGKGRGHGEGLQLELAKHGGATQDDILHQAYAPATR